MVVSNVFFIYLFFSFLFHSFFSSYIYLFCFILFYFSFIIIIIIVYIYIFLILDDWFFIYLLLILLYFHAWILNSKIDDFIIYIFVWFFYLFAGRDLGMHYPPFTHTHTHCVYDMSGALYSGLSNFRIRGDCVAVSQWMYFPSGHCENPS